MQTVAIILFIAAMLILVINGIYHSKHPHWENEIDSDNF